MEKPEWLRGIMVIHLEPRDVVVLKIDKDLKQRDVAAHRAGLEPLFPGHEILIVGPKVDLGVMRPVHPERAGGRGCWGGSMAEYDERKKVSWEEEDRLANDPKEQEIRRRASKEFGKLMGKAQRGGLGARQKSLSTIMGHFIGMAILFLTAGVVVWAVLAIWLKVIETLMGIF